MLIITNKDKILAIVDKQIQKLHDLSETSKMPLMDKEIRSLTELAKVVIEIENLETKKAKNEFDGLSAEELLLIQEFRSKK